MQETDIPGVDLNLLGPLAALLRERHVSRAAERARMSQPAMSRALAALRRVFGDELLVRGGGGYQLTPRAERLQRDLAAIVPQLESLFTETPYDPRTADRAFRLAGTDYVLSVIGPPLVRRVLAQSPATALHFGVWHEGAYRDVGRGVLDLAFTGGAAPPPLRSEPLFDDRYVCVMSAGHPLAGAGTLTLGDYLDCGHVVVDVLAGRQGTVDTRLEALGRARRASVTVSYHAFAAAAVRDTRLVATLPRRFAGHLTADRALAVTGAPEEIGTLSFAMAWHPRLDGDPAQRWLRDTIRAAAPTG
jgi:DNA-binding transcriptional LysR family regulator